MNAKDLGSVLPDSARPSHPGSIDDIRRRMFCDFCNTLEQRQIPYVILSGYRDYPEAIASDIDFMVSEEDFRKLPKLFSQPDTVPGARLIQMLEHESSARYYVLALQDGAHIAYLHPDSAASYRRKARLWLHSRDVLATRRKSPQGFWIPAVAVEFEYYFVKRIDKASVEHKHLQQFSVLLAQDPAGCRAIVCKLMPQAMQEEMLAAIASEDLAWFTVRRQELKRALARSAPRAALLTRLVDTYQETLRVIRRIAQPTGFVIAVLGPDGSGKTTVLRHLEQELAPAFRKSHRFHLRPHFGKKPSEGAVSNPHAQAARGWLASCLKVGLFTADYWLGWLRQVWPAKIRSTLVVFDRYYHDMLVDHKRYRLPENFAPARWLAPLIPQPDMWVVLSAPAESLVARKGEISLNDAHRLTAAYKKLASELPNAVIVDTGTRFEETAQQLIEAILDRLARRAATLVR